MQGSVYPHCSCKDPATGKPWRRGKGPDGRYWSDCPHWDERGHKRWGFVVGIRRIGPGKWEQRRKQGLPTRKAAEDALADEIGDVRAGTALSLADRRTTVGEWAAVWLASKINLRPSSVRSYRLIIRDYIEPSLGRVALAELTPAHIDAMRARIRSGRLRPAVSRRAEGGQVSTRTANQILAVLHGMLATAVKRRMLAWNPCAAVERESPERHEASIWSPAEAATFLDHVEAAGPPWAAVAYRLGLKFGMRRGEICALSWADIDGGTLHVRRNAVAVGQDVIIGEPKSRKGERTIPLAADPGMTAALRAWRKAQAEARLASGPSWQDTGLVVTDSQGAMVPPWLLSETFPKLAVAAGLPRITLHEGRHTAGSIWREAGVDLKVIQEWLGHSTFMITMDIYSHVRPAAHDAAAATAAAYWAAQSGTHLTSI